MGPVQASSFLNLPAPAAAPPAAPPADWKPSAPEDYVDLSEFKVPVNVVKHIASAEEALDLTAPALHRPVLMIHGLAQHADTWINFKNFLSGNPANPYGGMYHADREPEFLQDLAQNPGARVFTLDLTDNLASPAVNAGEVRKAITAIMKGTGATEVDLITHSMGSMSAREAMRQGENRVRNLVMVAPPNHGAMEATLATLADDSRIYSHYEGGRMGAMNALRLEYGPMGDVRNQWLHDLNEDWKNHSAAVHGAVITGVGLPTPDVSISGTSQGDGMVAAVQAPLEGADFYLMHPNVLPAGDPNFRDFQQFRYNHLQIVSEPEIYRQVAEILVPGSTPPPPPLPPPVRPTPSDLAATLQKSRDARVLVSRAQDRRQMAEQWREAGLMTALAGGTVMAGGVLTAAAGAPGFGLAVSLIGLATAGVGGYQTWRSGQKAREAADETARSATQALDLLEQTVHAVQRSAPASSGAGSTPPAASSPPAQA